MTKEEVQIFENLVEAVKELAVIVKDNRNSINNLIDTKQQYERRIGELEWEKGEIFRQIRELKEQLEKLERRMDIKFPSQEVLNKLSNEVKP